VCVCVCVCRSANQAKPICDEDVFIDRMLKLGQTESNILLLFVSDDDDVVVVVVVCSPIASSDEPKSR